MLRNGRKTWRAVWLAVTMAVAHGAGVRCSWKMGADGGISVQVGR